MASPLVENVTNPLLKQHDSGSTTLLEECPHEFCTEGYCSSCGLEMGPKMDFDSTYGESHVKRRSITSQGYQSEMEKVSGVSENLKGIVADKLNKSGSHHCRESTRTLRVFCELYVNGAKEGELKPEGVARSLKMTGKNLNQCLREVSGTGRKTIEGSNGETIVMPVVCLSPLDYIVEICSIIDKGIRVSPKIKISPHVENIRRIISQAIKSCPSLHNKRPYYVAAGFIKHYCVVNGLNLGDISSLISMSSPTLNQYSTEARKLCDQYEITVQRG